MWDIHLLELPEDGISAEPVTKDEEEIYANVASDGDVLISELQYLIQEEKLKNPDSPFATEFQVNSARLLSFSLVHQHVQEAAGVSRSERDIW